MAERIIELRPVVTPQAYLDQVQECTRRWFFEMMYRPLLRALALPDDALENSVGAIIEAVRRGLIRYIGGTFYGSFNADVSKEMRDLGAAWDRATATFKLPPSSLPPELATAIEFAERVFSRRIESLQEATRKKLPEEITQTLHLEPILDTALWKVDADLAKTMSSITAPPVLTAEQRRRLADEWGENLKRGIKDFAAEEVLRLRRDIQESAFAGNRYESVVKAIQRSYGVTGRKANFLARQETNLLMAKFKETRYAEAGVDEYKWRCVAGSKLHPVRPSHKILDGKIFRFDSPPITTAPGEPPRRNNPGEDYGCRCTAAGVVRFRRPA